MRPRHACLGISARRRQPHNDPKSFNEAEARMPRNLRPLSTTSSNNSGFNEAEARMPRNFEQGDPDRSTYDRFNEAEARMPRNFFAGGTTILGRLQLQ